MEQEWRQNSVIMEPVPVKPRADEADREGNTRSDDEENFVRLRVASILGFPPSKERDSRHETRRRALNWLCCGIPRRTCFRHKKSWRFPQPGALVQPLIMYALLIAALLYGLLEVFRARGASFNPADYSSSDMLLVFSRASGKGITMFLVLGLVIVVRGFNNSANELSLSQKEWLKWRMLHSGAMGLSCFLVGVLFCSSFISVANRSVCTF
jgi:hypothetical protein